MRFASEDVAARFVGAESGAITVICNAAVSDPPLPSETLTVKLFEPKSDEPGVPLKAPFEAITSQAGPAVFENVSGSASGSLALLVMVPE